MSHKIILSLWVLLLGAGASGAEELIGILGESVKFQVKTSPPFQIISWNKMVNTISRNIALVKFKEPCSIEFLHPDFQGRVNISKDCSELHLSRLKKKDAGRYTAGIVLPTSESVDETFDLRLFIRLEDSQLKVTCTPEGAGNGTWQLNCSTGSWEDRVNISWASSAKSTGPTPGSSVIQFTSQDLNATCTAKNPVSQASRIVSLKQACTEEKPGTEAPQVNDKGLTPSKALIAGVIVAVIVVLLILIILIIVWKKKAAKRNQNFTTCSGC